MAVLHFFKYQGTGNDFVILDNRVPSLNPADESLIAHLCDRRFGIGADGLMLLEMERGVDFRMRYFNADGREGSMCGNGGRCLVAFAHHLGLVSGHCRFMAVDGLHEAHVAAPDWIELKMTEVKEVKSAEGYYFLDTGSPHYVSFVDDIKGVDVAEEGKVIRWSEEFQPGGTNVNFVEQTKEGIKVATFERGVEAETLSCGTGVTAAALCLSLEQGKEGENEVPIDTRGGKLEVKFTRHGTEFTDIWLCGPAKLVFEGNINIKTLSRYDQPGE